MNRKSRFMFSSSVQWKASNLNAGLICSMVMAHWTCKPHHCTMTAISEHTTYLWTGYNQGESNYGLFQGVISAITKFTWKKQVTGHFSNVNVSGKMWTRYCLSISQKQLVQLLNRSVLQTHDISTHMGARVVPQLVEVLCHKTGGFGFGLREVLGNSDVAYSFGPHSVALESTQPLTYMRRAGTQSWLLYHTNCAECQS